MVSKKLQAEQQHAIIRAIFVCSNCGRYRVPKEVALPLRLPDELKAEYCPVCASDQKFLKIG